MKFGGTSVAGCEAITRVVDIVRGRLSRRPVVVVSAMSKVTDTLYRIAAAAAAQNLEEAKGLIDALRDKHVEAAEQLLDGKAGLLLPATSKVNEICDELENVATAVCALGELSDRSKAIIVSNGELLSSTIISYALNAAGMKTKWLDAREMIITDGEHMLGEPQKDIIQEKVPGIINEAMKDHEVVITQGFISSSVDGEPTVLGRGGSDYSASLIGMAVDAEKIEIWTDVDGVLTADPRTVKNAKPLSRISFEEATEMAHFGAKVLHPLTIEPAVRKNIPICVLNSMNPQGDGTLILQNDQIEDGVKSVSFKESIRVINIFSTKMINVSGFLSKVFDIFSNNGVSVDLISTTEANISVTCDANTKNIDKVIAELSEFSDVFVDDDKSQISIIGKNLINSHALFVRIFENTKDTKVYMMSQGASYINVSLVVDRTCLDTLVNNIHDSLFA